MNRFQAMEELLKKHKFNKERIGFIENHLRRFKAESFEDYIQYRMFSTDHLGAAPKFIMEGDEEVAQLNNVELTAQEYRDKCKRDYENAKTELEKELRELKYYTSVIDDALDMLENMNEKYGIIVKRYYIYRNRMEDIADSIHISRSRCYEMSKEAVRWMIRIVYGNNVVGI